jgi:hypothetical protein
MTRNPNKKIEEVIKSSDLPSLTKDYAELAIDGIMDDGVLKDFPLVASIIGFIKFGNSINQYLATKKIYKFLFQLNSIPLAKRVKKIEEINASSKYQSSVGEMIFELLEKIESDLKPEIAGKLMKAVIEEEIDYNTYLRLTHIIKGIFYQDLIYLKHNSNQDTMLGEALDSLVFSGLVNVNLIGTYENVLSGSQKNTNGGNKLTELGKILINTGMN